MGAPGGFRSLKLTFQMDDGAVHTVHAINPDFVAWDMTRVRNKWPSPQADDAPFPILNFLAWHAARREKLIPEMTFEQFYSERCHYIREEDDGEVDPTNPEPGAG